MVEPFSEIGMVAQVSAIQPVMDQPSRSLCDPSTLPDHLQGLLDQTSQDLERLMDRVLQVLRWSPLSGLP